MITVGRRTSGNQHAERLGDDPESFEPEPAQHGPFGAVRQVQRAHAGYPAVRQIADTGESDLICRGESGGMTCADLSTRHDFRVAPSRIVLF